MIFPDDNDGIEKGKVERFDMWRNRESWEANR